MRESHKEDAAGKACAGLVLVEKSQLRLAVQCITDKPGALAQTAFKCSDCNGRLAVQLAQAPGGAILAPEAQVRCTTGIRHAAWKRTATIDAMGAQHTGMKKAPHRRRLLS